MAITGSQEERIFPCTKVRENEQSQTPMLAAAKEVPRQRDPWPEEP